MKVMCDDRIKDWNEEWNKKILLYLSDQITYKYENIIVVED